MKRYILFITPFLIVAGIAYAQLSTSTQIIEKNPDGTFTRAVEKVTYWELKDRYAELVTERSTITSEINAYCDNWIADKVAPIDAEIVQLKKDYEAIDSWVDKSIYDVEKK